MKVFLSSTAQDLVAYRQVADDTILRLSQQAVVMERFGPFPGELVAECERKARESDVMVCIVAHRLGFVPEKGRGSITRREVEAARAAGKDVLAWIVADNHPWPEKKEQDLLTDPAVRADPGQVLQVAANVTALIEFKAWLQKTFVCDTFTTPDELGRKIAVALATYSVQRTPAVTSPSAKRGEIRIVHALQPAPHFCGREVLVEELSEWVADAASPDRVWALVAAGGTGKTAIVERVVRDMRPGEVNVLVWSFYERPEGDAFLRECNQLFLGEGGGPAGGRLERLQRGLRDGRPHLIVLDGLERVQEDASSGRVRGELSDQTLKLLLRTLVAGLGRARALVTSRFPLVDLQDWENHGYRPTCLDDLTPDAALAVLRGWGVVGEEAALRVAALQVGYHALSVAVIGSYLKSFANGRIEEIERFDLLAVTGDDVRAAKLARVLAFYAERLPTEERELITRLSLFPRGVTLELLGTLVDAGGEVAGALVNARSRLIRLLTKLKTRGLVFEYRSDADVTWTAHPFLREKFRDLLGCPAERVFEVVAESLSSGLEKRPRKARDPNVLDRYERLIEATRLAGRDQEAFELFWNGMDFKQLFDDGEYQRSHRILASFSPTGGPQDLGRTIEPRARAALVASLALVAQRVGRLDEALALRQVDDAWTKPMGDLAQVSVGLQLTSEVTLALGRVPESRALAEAAVTAGEAFAQDRDLALLFRAMSTHLLGDTPSARADFAKAKALAGASMSLSLYKGRHHVDLGELTSARALVEGAGWTVYRANATSFASAMYDLLLARLNLAEGNDPTPYIESLRAWTSQSGDMASIIEAHLLSARHSLALSDPQAALDEAETGLLHAIACGYRLLRIELLVTLARIRLGWPDPAKAIQAACEALDLAAHPECQYAWGEADAAQVWGEAYFANHEPAFANRAFTRALAVRKRIEHPGVAETERWVERCS